ncbi:sterol 24-C-methyltransferase [Amylocarpus encephaloides]|uniref:Sterol 24-C-methyltransferase n=1 Tax=Amylocarpus encephaloides TaxID=45428 RepID=A0A9P7YAX6_9HELO|nr:sterol 24-C-methyltransferase [Amylocarpus encephaloides]
MSEFLMKEDHERDAAFSKVMHGKSAAEKSAFLAMLKKDSKSQAAAADAYFHHWDNKDARFETEEDRLDRKTDYANLTRNYYDIATGLYEEAWGQSFHFCRFAANEPFRQAIARHEHYLASRIGLAEGMKVLDVGCGVGGPAREIASFADCHITGLNINDYQIQRANRAAGLSGMADQLKFVKGDFMQLPFPDHSFDAVYAIEATVHAPSLEGVYSEIFRVLKPGGTFGVYEWLMTDAYDPTNPSHRTIRLDIEQGDGIANMVSIKDAHKAIAVAGFDLKHAEDLATRPDDTPWYYPLAGDFKYLGTIWDFFTIFRMTRFARGTVEQLLNTFEFLRLAPRGSARSAASLAKAADALVLGAKQRLFTPMYLMVAKKPE